MFSVAATPLAAPALLSTPPSCWSHPHTGDLLTSRRTVRLEGAHGISQLLLPCLEYKHLTVSHTVPLPHLGHLSVQLLLGKHRRIQGLNAVVMDSILGRG